MTNIDVAKDGCKGKASWVIYTGNGPDDWTNSCTAHVGEMLNEGENKVLPVEAETECCYIGGQS